MVGQLVYIVVETTDTDSCVMLIHANEENARAKQKKLQTDFPYLRYWVDILRVKE